MNPVNHRRSPLTQFTGDRFIRNDHALLNELMGKIVFDNPDVGYGTIRGWGIRVRSSLFTLFLLTGWTEFARRRGDWGKGLVLWAARQYTGITLAQIGNKADAMDYTAVAMAIKRFEERAKKSGKWRDYKRHVAQKCEK